MPKSVEMEMFLEEVGKKLFGRSRVDTQVSQTCVACGGDANNFKDEISKREYNLSKLCQTCQDDVFGGE